MSFQIANDEQGELTVVVGVASKVNVTTRPGKKEGEKLPCVYVTVLALGAPPIDVKADMRKYNSDEVNPVGQQISTLTDGQPVLIVGRKRKFKDMVFFEPEKVHTEEQAFSYLGVLTGRIPMPSQRRSA